MILTALETVAYRVHQPRWAFAPTSGASAGRHGGRANRPGVDALYPSLDPETALAEYKQVDALLQPGLIVSYQVVASPIVDFRGGFTDGWDELWQDFGCDWRKLHFNDGIEPPSWVIGDTVLAAGVKGILFRSVLTPGANLVLYTAALAGSDVLAVHDPRHDLPSNQASWNS